MKSQQTMESLLKQNPKAAAEADRIERIREQVSELRKKGMKSKQFDLSSPFGKKLWLGNHKSGRRYQNDF
jgi:hypothetical protein